MKYTENYLLDELGQIVMPQWESPIMEHAAKTICRNGGKILNIGFGLGIIDTFIQEQNVEEHWIVESHPIVLEKMKNDGWYDKENVVIVEGDWKDVLPIENIKFDGIYYDTWKSGGQKYLIENLHKNLKVGGWFSFWAVLDEKSTHKWTNTFDALGYKTYIDEVHLSEGTEDEHFKVFKTNLNRKYTAISAQRIGDRKSTIL
tara:strand:- start:7507 stop:8112 length:606 start_codon:yes stop_codon:yes gene_type:complete